jgi:hypothetical protein
MRDHLAALRAARPGRLGRAAATLPADATAAGSRRDRDWLLGRSGYGILAELHERLTRQALINMISLFTRVSGEPGPGRTRSPMVG